MDQLKTKEGLGQGMPLTDIQEYNKQLKRNNLILGSLSTLAYFFFFFLLWVTWKVITYDVIGNVIRMMGRGC